MSRTGSCRNCGKEIMFIKAKTGKTVPVDPESVLYIPNPRGGSLFVLLDGSVDRGTVTQTAGEATGIGFISHFDTCQEADRGRRGRKSDRKKG